MDIVRTHAMSRVTAERDAPSWLRVLASLGFVARGIVYVVLSALAADIAVTGTAPAQASSNGAFVEVARQPAGPALLGVVAAGLVAYALWRLLSATLPETMSRLRGRERLGAVAAAAVYVGLFVQAISVLIRGASSGGPTSHPTPYVATALGWPGGPVWVGVAGASVIVAGIALAAWGIVHDYCDEMATGRLTPRGRTAVRTSGAFGNAVRGALVTLVGVYLLVGAVSDAPSKVKSVGQVLYTIDQQAIGPILLGVAAAGLLSFGIFSWLEARYREG